MIASPANGYSRQFAWDSPAGRALYASVVGILGEVLLVATSHWLQIVLFVVGMTAFGVLGRGRPAHPLSWFAVMYALYSAAYPILLLTTTGTYDDHAQKILPIFFLGAFGFAIVCTVLDRKNESIGPEALSVPRLTTQAASVLAAFAVSLALLGTFLVVQQEGLDSKREVLEAKEGNGLLAITDFASVVATLATLIAVAQWNKGRSAATELGALGAAMLTVFVVTGERDVLIRLLFSVFVAYLAWHGPKRMLTFLFAIVGGVFLLPVMQELKSAALRGQQSVVLSAETIFGGELQASGRNLHALLRDPPPLFWGETIWWDFKRILGSNWFGAGSGSTVAWFHDSYRPQHGIGGTAGWGFTLAGEGFLNFGPAGAAVLMGVLGVVAITLYNQRTRTIWHNATYFAFIPLAIYSIRADLANLFSPTMKLVVLPILMVYLIGWVAMRTKPTGTVKA